MCAEAVGEDRGTVEFGVFDDGRQIAGQMLGRRGTAAGIAVAAEVQRHHSVVGCESRRDVVPRPCAVRVAVQKNDGRPRLSVGAVVEVVEIEGARVEDDAAGLGQR